MQAKDKPPTNRIQIEDLAKLLGLPDWESVDDLNADAYHELAGPPGDDEEAHLHAVDAARDEVYLKWVNAVEAAASTLFEACNLDLTELPKQRGYRITPRGTWEDAAVQILHVIKGDGIMLCSLNEWLGGRTPRQAVLENLGWIKRRSAVYHTPSARTLYDLAWR